MTTERCIDGSPHKFVHLKHDMREKSRYFWVNVDTYFCEKCLKYQEVETEKQEPRRW